MIRDELDVTVSNINHIGYWCRMIRRNENRSQESVALELGVATSTLERIENGKVTPSLISMIRIFDALNYGVQLKKKDPQTPRLCREGSGRFTDEKTKTI